MNPVVLLIYNTTEAQFKLTQLAYESILAQDIGPLLIWIVNNGSTDGQTSQWLASLKVDVPHQIVIENHKVNRAPTRRVNATAATIFALGHEMILGLPNDVVAPANLYSEMAKWPRGFVAAWMNGNFEYKRFGHAGAVHTDPHFSVMLTRRWAYEALRAKDGYFFDEGFFLYGSDCDMKLRMAACGISGVQLDIECYHYGSACWRLAQSEVSSAINGQADIDRAYFAQKWGFGIGSPEHEAAIKDLNFRG